MLRAVLVSDTAPPLYYVLLAWSSVRLWRDGWSALMALLWALAAAAGMLTHYFFVFVWAGCTAWLLLAPGWLSRRAALATAAAVVLLVTPWYVHLPQILEQWRVTKGWIDGWPDATDWATAPLGLANGLAAAVVGTVRRRGADDRHGGGARRHDGGARPPGAARARTAPLALRLARRLVPRSVALRLLVRDLDRDRAALRVAGPAGGRRRVALLLVHCTPPTAAGEEAWLAQHFVRVGERRARGYRLLFFAR